MNLNIKITLIFLCIASFAYTQTTINPFELSPRSSKAKSKIDTSVKNPFELNESPSIIMPADESLPQIKKDTSAANSSPASDTFQITEPGQTKLDTTEIQGNPFAVISNNKAIQNKENKLAYPTPLMSRKTTKEKTHKMSFLPIIIFNLLIFTVLLTIFRTYISKIYKAILNDTMFNQLFSERFNVNFSAAFIPLYILFFFNLSFFIYLILTKEGYFSDVNRYIYLGYFTVGLMTLFALKHLLLLFVGNTFSVKTEAGMYNFLIIVFSIFTGLILVFFNLILVYTSPEASRWFSYLALAVIMILYALRIVRGLFIANKFLVFHKFHFLLYICTLEIAPVLILYRLLTQQAQ